MRRLCALCLILLTACKPDTSRVEAAERAAAATCSCPDETCATEAAEHVLDGRGLLLEDYENLPQDEVERYEAAVERLTACLARFDEG